MNADAPRIVFFGYSEVGYRGLELLLRRKANVVAVISHQDDPKENQWFRSVPKLAAQHGIPLHTPEQLKASEWLPVFEQELKPDLIFSFYYRHMIPTKLLAGARLGAFNMHGSYLPFYRGRAPVNWAVLNGETFIGATLHYMVREPDAGDIVDQEKVPIGPRETSSEVMAKVTEACVTVLDRQLDNLLAGTAPRVPQDHSQATYFTGRKPEDGRIDWAWPTARIFNLIRAVTRPYPGAFTELPGRGRITVWWAEPCAGQGIPGTILSESPLRIATGDGALEITDSQKD
jgi:methionyl-tRNA formyltransferase